MKKFLLAAACAVSIVAAPAAKADVYTMPPTVGVPTYALLFPIMNVNTTGGASPAPLYSVLIAAYLTFASCATAAAQMVGTYPAIGTSGQFVAGKGICVQINF